ncbi:hypothetical protein BJV74DRAFT_798379 [Russula compacta]|nr:hypothetical protein BJV74DRAFT_798379 [Russula compacta]
MHLRIRHGTFATDLRCNSVFDSETGVPLWATEKLRAGHPTPATAFHPDTSEFLLWDKLYTEKSPGVSRSPWRANGPQAARGLRQSTNPILRPSFPPSQWTNSPFQSHFLHLTVAVKLGQDVGLHFLLAIASASCSLYVPFSSPQVRNLVTFERLGNQGCVIDDFDVLPSTLSMTEIKIPVELRSTLALNAR